MWIKLLDIVGRSDYAHTAENDHALYPCWMRKGDEQNPKGLCNMTCMLPVRTCHLPHPSSHFAGNKNNGMHLKSLC